MVSALKPYYAANFPKTIRDETFKAKFTAIDAINSAKNTRDVERAFSDGIDSIYAQTNGYKYNNLFFSLGSYVCAIGVLLSLPITKNYVQNHNHIFLCSLLVLCSGVFGGTVFMDKYEAIQKLENDTLDKINKAYERHPNIKQN